MDRDEALKLLKGGEEGIAEWNRRRAEGEEIPSLEGVDLRGAQLLRANLFEANLNGANLFEANLNRANLNGANLNGANLRRANLNRANLNGANLRRANLSGANLRKADLNGANLRRANLRRADLSVADIREANLIDADLSGADLSVADLRGADLSGADLRGADLSVADISGADLSGADLRGADLQESRCLRTHFTEVDLTRVKGLETIEHHGPSAISTSTLVMSNGNIPEKFLKGCGLADWEIEAAKLYQPNLRNDEFLDIQQKIFNIRSGGAFQVNSLFISYSHDDSEFVDTMESLLDEKGIRFWRDTHDMKSGRMEKQIDRALRFNPTVLLVLSENSVKSKWVEWEAAKAQELEEELGRDVLCPVALDKEWETCKWPGWLRHQIKQYNVLDFSEWLKPEVMKEQFKNLVDGLELFYREEGEAGS